MFGDGFGRNSLACALASALMLAAAAASAQQTDKTQTPAVEGVGINKSLAEEVGLGRGDMVTPDSSIYNIARDPFRAIRRGRQLFQRKFTASQGLGPRALDGVGDIARNPAVGAGLADSCASCHGRPKGSGGAGGDVATRPDSRDAPHLFGLGLVEMLGDEMTSDLRAIRASALQQAQLLGRPVTVALQTKGVRFGTITAQPSGALDSALVEGVDPDLRVRPFFAHGGQFSMRAFVVGALNDEMGLQSVDPDLAAAALGGRVITPSGLELDGTKDRIPAPPAASAGDDPDGDGVRNEVPASLVDYLEFYMLNYFRPAIYRETETTEQGRRVFEKIGCNSCHVQDLPIEHDRRVADVDTRYDAVRGILNSLFATATPRLVVIDDGPGVPPRKLPAGQSFVVKNIFSDLKRHDLGPALHERNYDGTMTLQFVTEPLWGVGTTAPYGHDGRSINLEEVILRHGGEAQPSRDAFAALPDSQRQRLVAFLNALVLFPPDDTASNLDPGDPNAPGFPQRGHGSVRLTTLFNDPSDPE